jgi:hypothetical protein
MLKCTIWPLSWIISIYQLVEGVFFLIPCTCQSEQYYFHLPVWGVGEDYSIVNVGYNWDWIHPVSPCTPLAGVWAGHAGEQSRTGCETAAPVTEPLDSPECPFLCGHCPAIHPILSCHPAPVSAPTPLSADTGNMPHHVVHSYILCNTGFLYARCMMHLLKGLSCLKTKPNFKRI